MSSESTEPDFTAPVIIVGPGRSGTTLLGAALGAHPDFYMIGETQLLLHRLWRTFFEFPDYVNYRRFSSLAQQTRPEWSALPWYTFRTEVAGLDLASSLKNQFAEIETAETTRVARELGASFARMLIPPALRRRRWGMQEIWLGSDAFPYTSDLYRMAFPNALYLHLMRNPFTYLASNFNNNNLIATDQQAVHELGQWLKMTKYVRTLADTGRYMEFRHEDLVADGGYTAERVFAFCGLDMVEACRRVLTIRHLPSSGPNSFISRADELFESVPGLREELERHA